MQASQMTVARRSHKAQEARQAWARAEAFVLKTTGKRLTGKRDELPAVLLELARVLRGPRFVPPKSVSASFRAVASVVTFLEACEAELGLSRAQLFEPGDVCGERADELRVLRALELVARRVEGKGKPPVSPSKHGAVPPPSLLRTGTPAAAAAARPEQPAAAPEARHKKKAAPKAKKTEVQVAATREVPAVKTEYRLERAEGAPRPVPQQQQQQQQQQPQQQQPQPRSNSQNELPRAKSPRVRKLTAIAQLPEIKDRRSAGAGAGGEEEVERMARELLARPRYAGLQKRVRVGVASVTVEDAVVPLVARAGEVWVRRGDGLQPLSTWLDRRFFLLLEEKHAAPVPPKSLEQTEFDETEHLRWLLEKNTLAF